MATSGEGAVGADETKKDFALERYRYILQQINGVNENTHRFLAIYQTLVTSLMGAVIALFVGYHKWQIKPATARGGVIALMALATVVAAFTTILVIVGSLAWLDYRHEECDITDELVGVGFRRRPRPSNLFRWYETYVLLFILVSVVTMWCLVGYFLLPAMK